MRFFSSDHRWKFGVVLMSAISLAMPLAGCGGGGDSGAKEPAGGIVEGTGSSAKLETGGAGAGGSAGAAAPGKSVDAPPP